MRSKRYIFSYLFAAGLMFSVVPQSYALNEFLEGPADVGVGASQWANNCARCHNYRNASEYTPNQWRVIMLHMSTVGGLTGQEARNVYAFLTENQQAGVSPAVDNSAANENAQTEKVDTSSLTGEQIYKQTCIACHGADGKGAVPGAADFVDHTGPLSKPDAVLLKHIEFGFQKPGNPIAMPAKGGNPALTKKNIEDVLKYIRATFG